MIRKMKLEIQTTSGHAIEALLVYEAANEQEINDAIDRDRKELLDYMMTGDDHGRKSFVFGGNTHFMVKKTIIEAAQIMDPDF